MDYFLDGSEFRFYHFPKLCYKHMLNDILSATKFVLFQSYVFYDDALGAKFLSAFKDALKRGVCVTIIVDSYGQYYAKASSDMFDELKSLGAKIILFQKFSFWNLVSNTGFFLLNNRNHRKILVVDGKVGYLGGLNVGVKYSKFRDSHVRVKGNVVIKLVNAFRESEFIDDKSLFLNNRFLRSSLKFQKYLFYPVKVLRTVPGLSDRYIRREFLNIINSSRKSVYLTHCYFLPDRRLLRAMYRAKKRGVDFRIIVPKFSDVPQVSYASSWIITKLLSKGFKIYFYNDGILHAKTVVVDGSIVSLGSSNFDIRSFKHNYEINLFLKDRAIAKSFETQFKKDASNSILLTLDFWKTYSSRNRFKEFFWRLFSEWL